MLIKTLNIIIGESEMEVDVGLNIEDIGIGAWECHGRGYDIQEVIVWDKTVHAIRMESYKSIKEYEFNFTKLNARHQNIIVLLIEKAIERLNIHDIKQEIIEG